MLRIPVNLFLKSFKNPKSGFNSSRVLLNHLLYMFSFKVRNLKSINRAKYQVLCFLFFENRILEQISYKVKITLFAECITYRYNGLEFV
jgi:hypothetical protein